MVSIAARYGMPWEKIYNHPDNAGLKRNRPDPNLLLEGDEVVVPDKERREADGATEARHRFRLLQEPARIRLKLTTSPTEDEPAPESAFQRGVFEEPEPEPFRREPLAGAPYRLYVEDELVDEGSTDDDGMLEATVSPAASTARLVLDPDSERERTIDLHLGQMDPVEEDSGIVKRLRNLGYPVADSGDDDELAAAVASFQRDQGLEVNGRMDGSTRTALVEAHGG